MKKAPLIIISFAALFLTAYSALAGSAGPMIMSGSVSVQNITSSGAQVTWGTDDPSDSMVRYDTVSGNYTYITSPSQMCGGTTPVTAHCVNLFGLQPATTYYYKVVSTNASGTGEMAGFSFTTTGTLTPQPPTGFSRGTPSETSVPLYWNTAPGAVYYQLEREVANSATWIMLPQVTGTSYLDAGLVPSTTYNYRLKACATSANCSPEVFLYTVITTSSVTQTIPNAPSSLRLGGTPSATAIPLAWNDNSSNEDKFNIDRKLDTDATYMPLTQITTANTIAYTDNTVAPGTMYDYRVQACLSGVGCSPYAELQNVSSAATLSTDTTAPSVPTGLNIPSYNSTQVYLRWTPSTDNVGVAGYRIYRQGGGSSTLVNIGSSPTPDFTDTTVVAGSPTYYYSVSAYDAGGNESPRCPNIPMNVPATTIVTKPNAPVLATPVIGANSVTLNWTESTPGVSGFKMYKKISGLLTDYGNVPGSQMSFTDGSLTPGTYDYNVQAFINQNGTPVYSDLSNQVTATIPSAVITTDVTPPSAPGNFTAIANSPSRIDLFWSASTDNVGVIGYGIFRNGIFVATTTNTNFSDLGLSPGTAYGYFVKAADGAGNMSRSLTAYATTPINTTTNNATTTTATTTSGSITTVSIMIGKSSCDTSGHATTPIHFIATPTNGAYFKFGLTLGSTTEMVGPQTPRTLPNGAYTWSAFAMPGYTLSGKTSDDFLLSFECAGYIAPPPPPPISPTTTTIPPPAPPTTMMQKTVTTNTPGPVPEILPEKKVEQPAPIAPATSAQAITSFAQYTNYCDDPAHQKECQKFVATPVAPIVPVTSVIPEIPPDRFNALVTGGAVLPGDAKSPEELVPLCGQTQFAERCAELLVEAKLADADAAKKRAEELRAKHAAVEKVFDARIGARVFQDKDKDGISDFDETNVYRTDPQSPDTNKNGVSDGDELLAGTDPVASTSVASSETTTTGTLLRIFMGTTTDIVKPKPGKRIAYENPRFAGDTKPELLKVATATLLIDEVAGVTTAKTMINGKGLPNSFVTLYLFSDPIVVTVKTDEEGNWTYTLDKELPDGTHTVFSAITDTGGRILAKSEPLPFVKTAQALTLGGVPIVPAEVEPGFFSGTALLALVGVIITVLIAAVFLIGIVIRKKEPVADPAVVDLSGRNE